ncbi:UNVERIFIED_CONTAM: Zinc finger protein AZF2 [Sesamum latifolium]|uniref:Zinc finger protein AZF2 n=1 Tax=Sesamum latifolium TaxID=2727402 RepID=A0AAW2XNJ4_9LAMI
MSSQTMSVMPTSTAVVPPTQPRLRRRCRRFVDVDQAWGVRSWPEAKRCKIMDDCVTSEEEEIVAECLLMLARSGGGFCQALTPPAPDEEYVADCLVVLAGSGGDASPSDDPTTSLPADDSEKQKDNCYKCDVCDKVLPSYQALGGHKTSHRSKPPTAAATATVETSSGTNYSSGRPHACPICHKAFPTAKHFTFTRAQSAETPALREV